MNADAVITIGKQAIELTTLLMLLLLVPSLVVGLAVSVFQAATQINEQTLSFIPKMLVTLALLVFAGPLMLRLLMEFTVRLFEGLPSMVG